jgi:hypothetical protein
MHKELVIVTFIAILLASTPLHADRILVIGDSGAVPIGTELQTVLQENGHMDVIVETTPFIGTAWQMRARARLDDISAWLDEMPDVTVVHINIGGNDWGASDWTPFWAGTAAERNLIAGIIRNVEVVVDHIFSLRPDIQIMWKSFEFPRPYGRGTPAEINAFMITMDEQRAQFAATRAGLIFVDVKGTLQVAYGFDGVQHTPFDPAYVIPPGDPSLPDPGLPSPFEAYIPNEPFHKTPEGNKVVARTLYDLFYEPLLNGQDFHINAGLNDAWYDPLTDGQGFFITVFPDLDKVSLAWFTYDTELPPEDATANLGDPGHRWMTAIGPIDGNRSVMNVTLTSGGIFDTPTEIERTDPPGSDGTITLIFDSCNSGTIEYNITSIGQQGIVPIQRVADDNVVICEALKAE